MRNRYAMISCGILFSCKLASASASTILPDATVVDTFGGINAPIFSKTPDVGQTVFSTDGGSYVGTSGFPNPSISIQAVSPLPSPTVLFETSITADLKYYFEVNGPATSSPLIMDITGPYAFSVGDLGGATGGTDSAVIRVSGAGNLQPGYALGDQCAAPCHFSGVFSGSTLVEANSVGMIEMIGYTSVYNVPGTVFIDPMLSLTPEELQAGYSISVSPNVGDASAVPELGTLPSALAGLTLIAWMKRSLRRKSEFPGHSIA